MTKYAHKIQIRDRSLQAYGFISAIYADIYSGCLWNLFPPHRGQNNVSVLSLRISNRRKFSCRKVQNAIQISRYSDLSVRVLHRSFIHSGVILQFTRYSDELESRDSIPGTLRRFFYSQQFLERTTQPPIRWDGK
jgi:hypothetical protein